MNPDASAMTAAMSACSPEEIVDAIRGIDSVRPGLAYDVGKLLVKLNPCKTVPVPVPPTLRIRLTGALSDDKTRVLLGLRKFFYGDYEATQALYKKLMKEGLDGGTTVAAADGGADAIIRAYARYDIRAEAIPYTQDMTETISLADSFVCTG